MEKRSFFYLAAMFGAFFTVNYLLFPPKPLATAERESPKVENVIEVPAQSVAHRDKEKFYILENDYQQVVVSNLGGAIAEINLPFSEKTNIQPSHLDQKLADEFPQNSLFPVHTAQRVTDAGVIEHQEPAASEYLPLLRRALFSNPSQNHPSVDVSPRNYALYLHEGESDEPRVYSVSHHDKHTLELVNKEADRIITKTFRLPGSDAEAPYAIEMDVSVNGKSPQNMWVTSGVLEAELVAGQYSPALQYLDQTSTKHKAESLKLPKSPTLLGFLQPQWIAQNNGFFGTLLHMQNQKCAGLQTNLLPSDTVPSRLSLVTEDNYDAYETHIPYTPSDKKTKFLYYAGPYNKTNLQKIDTAYSESIGYASPFFAQAGVATGWFSSMLSPVASFLLFLMKSLYSITHSWGISIILLTVVLRLMLFPLNSWSFRSSMKMQRISPKIKALQEKYKNDPKTMNQEMALLYRNEGLNPLSAFVPLLIQLPVLFAMFNVLRSTFELRGAGFIPGWINDLTAPDTIFSWGTHIPFIGTGLHILPLILAALAYVHHLVSQKCTPNTKAQKQDNPMGNMGVIKTVLMLVLFYNMASGLNIYWITSTLFDIVQQWYVGRSDKKGKRIGIWKRTRA